MLGHLALFTVSLEDEVWLTSLRGALPRIFCHSLRAHDPCAELRRFLASAGQTLQIIGGPPSMNSSVMLMPVVQVQ